MVLPAYFHCGHTFLRASSGRRGRLNTLYHHSAAMHSPPQYNERDITVTRLAHCCCTSAMHGAEAAKCEEAAGKQQASCNR